MSWLLRVRIVVVVERREGWKWLVGGGGRGVCGLGSISPPGEPNDQPSDNDHSKNRSDNRSWRRRRARRWFFGVRVDTDRIGDADFVDLVSVYEAIVVAENIHRMKPPRQRKRGWTSSISKRNKVLHAGDITGKVGGGRSCAVGVVGVVDFVNGAAGKAAISTKDQRQRILVDVEVRCCRLSTINDLTCVVDLADRCGGADGGERETG